MIKKICILTTAHTATDIRIFHKEAKTLSQAGYKVEIIGQNPRRENIGGIEIFPFPPSQRFFRFFLMPLKMFFYAVRRQADVYHFHDPELIATGMFLKFFRRKPVIYDAHENYSQAILYREWLPEFLRSAVSFVFNIFEKIAAQFFDYVIGATPHIASSFRGPTIVLFNYPLALYFKNILSGEKKNGSEEGRFTVICTGNFEGVRGIEEIVSATGIARRQIGIKLKLMGKFSDGAFKKKIMDLEGWKTVEFLEWVPLEDVYDALGKADAGIVCFLPTKVNIDAIPNKIFEYMAAGLPLVYSNFPLWKEIIGDCGVAVDPQNSGEIAAALEFLARNPREAEKMGQRGRKAVQEVYNWESEGKKLLAIYGSL